MAENKNVRHVRFRMRISYLDYLIIRDIPGLDLLGCIGSKVGPSTSYCTLERGHFEAGLSELKKWFTGVKVVPESEWTNLSCSIPLPNDIQSRRLQRRRSMAEPTLKYDPEVARIVQGINDWKSGRGWALLRLEEVFGVNIDLNIAKSVKEK
ncbi:MAG: hypothetical protein AAB632_01195 [Patescibacteria group bacterium]